MTTTNDGAPATSDRPLKDLIGNITDDLSRLFRQEVELAKAEVKQEGKKVATATAMFAAAVMALLLTATMISLAVVYLLTEVMHPGLAALLVGVLWAVAAVVLQATARTRMRSVAPLPQTAETLKENAQWLQNPTK